MAQPIATIEERQSDWARRIRQGQECMTRKSLKKGCPRLMRMVEEQLRANTTILKTKFKPRQALPRLYSNVNLRAQ